MEKRTAHYSLIDVQAAVAKQGMEAFTYTARLGVFAMDLSAQEALDVIASLTRNNFYKSMTAYGNHKVWQDVYHATCPNGKTAYIKFTAVASNIVIQFKEK